MSISINHCAQLPAIYSPDLCYSRPFGSKVKINVQVIIIYVFILSFKIVPSPGIFTFFLLRFILNLVGANLLSCTVFAPTTMLLSMVASDGLSVLVVTSSIFSVVAIAIDRYSAVLNPLHYAMSVTRTRSIVRKYILSVYMWGKSPTFSV